MTSEIQVVRVPQCDPMGYESESYQCVSVIVDGTCFEYPYLVLLDKRDESGILTGIIVAQNLDDYELRNPDKAEVFGTVPLYDTTSETQYDLALAAWLLTSPQGQDLDCEVC